MLDGEAGSGEGGEGVFAAGNVEFIGCSLIDRVV